MKALKLTVRILIVALVAAAFFGVPLCWISLKIQGIFFGMAATLLFGRFFCNAICPLGIWQSFVNWVCHPKRHVRRVCTRLPVGRGQWAVRGTVLAVAIVLAAVGMMGVAELVLPISILGKTVTGWTPGVVMGVAVTLLAAIGDGRIWCNWVCPFGTVYALVGKLAIFKSKVGEGCGNCRKCFGKEAKVKGVVEGIGVERREVVKGVALLAAADKITDGGFAEVSLPGVPERGGDVLPPGSVSRDKFALKCAGCQLCVQNCSAGCLVPSTKLKSFGQPVMDFRRGYCISTCTKCGDICPESAILKLQPEQRPNVHMGEAVWKKELCLRTAKNEQCTVCVRKCPVRAIHLVKGVPVVDRDRCIGCGACEHVCPARPMPAIYVKGYDMQRIVNPIAEADLVAEMKRLVSEGKACVVARGGVIVAQLEGRGIKPILSALDKDPRFFTGAVVFDKIVGRAAAAIYLTARPQKVYAEVMCKGAKEMLVKAGIVANGEKLVERIVNREGTDDCPMEKAVRNLDDPKRMIEAIRATLKKLGKAKKK